MSPGEEDKREFAQDIVIRDVKVVFESRNRDVAVDLEVISASIPEIPQPQFLSSGSYILFHILLACHHSALSNLESHLRRGFVHEAPEIGGIGPAPPLCRGWLIRVSIIRVLRLLLGHWQRRRPHHRHSRDMLRYGVVKGRRLCWLGREGASLHGVSQTQRTHTTQYRDLK